MAHVILPRWLLVAAAIAAAAAGRAATNDPAALAADPVRMQALVSSLKPAAVSGDAESRIAIESLTHHVQRPGASAREREAWGEALESALGAEKDPVNRAFLIEQIGQLAREASVRALVPLLSDDALFDPAARALAQIGGKTAQAALMLALADATPARVVGVLNALADAGWVNVEAAAKYAQSDDAAIRLAAGRALAGMPAAQVTPILREAMEKAEGRDREELAVLLLQQAPALSPAAGRELADEIGRKAAEWSAESLECAALAAHGRIRGEASENVLLARLADPRPALRAQAARILLDLASSRPAALVARVAAPDGAPEVLLVFCDHAREAGERGYHALLLPLLSHSRTDVALAAGEAVARTAAPSDVKDLAGRLASTNRNESAAARVALVRMRAKGTDEALAVALGDGGPATAALVAIAGERAGAALAPRVAELARSADEAVRTAAVEAMASLATPAQVRDVLVAAAVRGSDADALAAGKSLTLAARRLGPDPAWVAPLVAGFEGAPAPRKAQLAALLPLTADRAGLAALQKAASDSDEAVRRATLKALGEWPDIGAAEALLARAGASAEDRGAALRSLARLLTVAKPTPVETAAVVEKALAVATSAEEKRLVLARLGDAPCPESMAVLARLLDDADIKADAAAAVARLVAPADDKPPFTARPEDRGTIEKAAAAASDKGAKDRLGKLLKEGKAPQEKPAKKAKGAGGAGAKAAPAEKPEAKAAAAVVTPVVALVTPRPELRVEADGFAPLFNGRNLEGWTGDTVGYVATNGTITCVKGKGGNLLTTRDFDNFILTFEFQLDRGANNGLGIRAPEKGNAAYAGMELQIIDNDNYQAVHNYTLQPWQVHGSIYGVVPAKTGALKPVGEWNQQEVRAVGDRITVILNGVTILEADLSTITETADGKGLAAHPGLARTSGRIGFLGHGDQISLRNIRIKELHNIPPRGFAALFNGKDLTGWKGLVGNPLTRAKMKPEELKAAQAAADEKMRAHWRVEDGALVFDGKGDSLCTAGDYGDFEMLVDWKILPDGDSGIYLRGSPQVQIWDAAKHPEGSGGLYNNKQNPSKPQVCADRPVGQWNTFRIRMTGEKVTVWLNDVLVVDAVTMENYWDRAQPIFATGQIELQNHGNTLWFRNVFVKAGGP